MAEYAAGTGKTDRGVDVLILKIINKAEGK